MSNRFISRKITFLSSKRGRNSNNKISLISSSKVKKKKFPKGKKYYKEDYEKNENFLYKKPLFKNNEKDKFSDFYSVKSFSTTNSHNNSDYSEIEEKDILLKNREFIDENGNKLKFKCVKDNIFNLDKIITKEEKDGIWNDIDNDIKTDDEQIKRGPKKMKKFIGEEIEKILKDKKYLKNMLSRKLKFKRKKH